MKLAAHSLTCKFIDLLHSDFVLPHFIGAFGCPLFVEKDIEGARHFNIEMGVLLPGIVVWRLALLSDRRQAIVFILALIGHSRLEHIVEAEKVPFQHAEDVFGGAPWFSLSVVVEGEAVVDDDVLIHLLDSNVFRWLFRLFQSDLFLAFLGRKFGQVVVIFLFLVEIPKVLGRAFQRKIGFYRYRVLFAIRCGHLMDFGGFVGQSLNFHFNRLYFYIFLQQSST